MVRVRARHARTGTPRAASARLIAGTVVWPKWSIDAASTDPKEKEANDFALTLITGKPETRVVPKARWPKAEELARAAQQLGRQLGVDPGHIVLNYAHSMPTGSFWGVAIAALKLLPVEGDPTVMIRERMSANLDWARLPAEAAEFVARMTGQGGNTLP